MNISQSMADAIASGKEALVEAKSKGVEMSKSALEGATDVYSSSKTAVADSIDGALASSTMLAAREKSALLADYVRSGYENAGAGLESAYSASSERIRAYSMLGAEQVGAYFSRTIEVDKETDQIVSEIKGRLPAKPRDLDHILEQTKREGLRRAISAFCLAPIMGGLDRVNEANFSNLSQSYSEFKKENNLHDDRNFARLNNERDAARKHLMRFSGVDGAVEGSMLVDGYSPGRGAVLDPFSADIEHVIPKREIYDDLLLRIATNDDGIIEAMNLSENLIFTDESLNGSKSDWDLLDYIDEYGTSDPDNPDEVRFVIGKSQKKVVLSRREARERYEKAREQQANYRREVVAALGLRVASAGARMAAQQVVGLIVSETVDIFVDEIGDITRQGMISDSTKLMAEVEQRRASIAMKLSVRFEERQIISRAKEAGLEGGVAGVLSALPQVLISLLVKLPALVLSIIRECTLSTVRCVRVLLGDSEDKYEKIGVILLGGASAVVGMYVAHLLAKALVGVPLLNLFSSSVSDVLSGVLVVSVSLSAIYVFDQKRAVFSFSRIAPGGESAPGMAPGAA